MQTEKVILKEANFTQPLQLTPGAPKKLWNPGACFNTALAIVLNSDLPHLELTDAKTGELIRCVPLHMLQDYAVADVVKAKPAKKRE